MECSMADQAAAPPTTVRATDKSTSFGTSDQIDTCRAWGTKKHWRALKEVVLLILSV
jgi:hypothetical protein